MWAILEIRMRGFKLHGVFKAVESYFSITVIRLFMPRSQKISRSAASKRMRFLSFLLLAMLVLVLTEVNQAQAAPTYQALGNLTEGTGTGNFSVAWPAHAVDDIALLFVETTGGQAATLFATAGFVAVLNSPQATGATTAGTQITVFWARATSTSMASPSVTVVTGNHVYARIITYRGVINTGDPWDVTGGGVKAVASTSLTVTGVTTTLLDTLIVQVAAHDRDNAGAHFSAQTNASLAGIAERSDAGTTQGNGGGFAVWDGVKATAGATGNTTATLSNSVVNAFLTIALQPPMVINSYYPGSASIAAGATSITLSGIPRRRSSLRRLQSRRTKFCQFYKNS